MDFIILWTNSNAGFLALILFGITLLLGWSSGIFTRLRYRANFILEPIEEPTFCCTFKTGRKHQEADTHRTAIVIYLSIKNVGVAPSEIFKSTSRLS